MYTCLYTPYIGLPPTPYIPPSTQPPHTHIYLIYKAMALPICTPYIRVPPPIPGPHGTRSKPPHPKLYIGSRYGYIRGKHMSQHHYEAVIMNAWYAYDGPMSFEQFYATYVIA